jgi:hypothetical protein
MQPVAAAATAILIELQPVRRVLFVFCRHVIALFALGALQNYVISRHFFNSLWFVVGCRWFVAKLIKHSTHDLTPQTTNH